MAIKISGTTVIDDSRQINNIGILTATQIADGNGSVGAASSVLSSTGSGLSWVAQSGGGGGASGVWETNATGINTSTNVGIGTTTASDATLTVDVGTASTAVVVQGSEGRLFSVTNSLSSGSIFSVNDISGIPSIDVDADGTIQLAPFSTNEYIGLGITNPTSKLHVVGSATVTDTLKVGTGITAHAGVITATTFKGALQGDVTGTLQTAAQPNITSLGTLSSLSVTGDVSIGGTLTYEDVTNIDSVGLITARSGVVVVGGGVSIAAGGLSVSAGIGTISDTLKVGTAITAHAGVITATTFDGSGANLTGLTGASANTYGDASNVAQIVVNSDGKITGISEVTISGGGGGGGADVGVSTSSNSNVATVYVGTGVTNFNFVGTGVTASLTAGASANTVANVFIPSAVRKTNRYIATADQTTFSATYSVGYVDVFLNGIKLDGQDEFTATNGTSVVLTDGATVNDIVEIVAQQISANMTITGITDVVDDTTPQLGGNLDVNGKDISGTGDVNLTGIVTATTFSGGYTDVDLSGLLKEGVNITAGQLSDNPNINLTNGMVHLFTTTDDATSTPNIISTTGINTEMSTGEAITVVIISATAAAAYSAQLTIDHGAATEEWLGGSAPSAGGSGGYDVYTHNIIKKGDADFLVLSNLVNFA